MRKKILRLALATLGLAAAFTATSRPALAFGACPSDAVLTINGGWYDCSGGSGSDCSTCRYYCSLLGQWVYPVYMCET